MKIVNTVFFVFFFYTISFSQNSTENQNDSVNIKKRSLLFKMKFAPLPLGNSLYLITSIGTDFRFYKNHSIGLLFYRSQYGYQEEEIKDTSGVTHYSVNTDSKTHKSFVCNYRNYFKPLKFNEERSFIFYTGLFYRYGEIVEKNFPLYFKSYYYLKEKNNSGGLFFGLLSKFGKHIGYDINFGLYTRQSVISSQNEVNNIMNYKIENKSSLGVRVDFGLTFIF